MQAGRPGPPVIPSAAAQGGGSGPAGAILGSVMKKKNPPNAPPSYPIGSVDNALKLLARFGTQREIRMTDAAQYLGVAGSTAHRLLAMLEYHGFVVQDPVSRLYAAGPALVALGLSVAGSLSSYARPVMLELSRAVGETVSLSVLREQDSFFLDSVECDQVLRISSRAGVSLPAYCTSGGKAMLACLTTDELRLLYPRDRLRPLTDASIRTRSALEAELEAVRGRGYGTNFGESEKDLSAVGAAILDQAGRVRGAVAVAAPGVRLGPEEAAALAPEVMRAAKEIGRLVV